MQITVTLFTLLASLVSSVILADIIVIMHLGWILFMLVGFTLTVHGVLYRKKSFFDRWLFRTLHLSGLVFVSLIALIGRQIRAICPITIWENALRARYDPSSAYSGEFIPHYVEKLVYPDMDPLIITIGTVFIGVFTLVVFIVRPPEKIRRILFKAP